MKKYIWSILILTILCQCADNDITRKVYSVKKTAGPKMVLDGIVDSVEWEDAVILTDFKLPWKEHAPHATVFRALHDDSLCYFAFVVNDTNLVVEDEFPDEKVLVREDRVELFFATDEKMQKYFCMELDPKGRVLDYSASFYRNFDATWNFPFLKTASAIHKGAYVVEGSIPIYILEQLGIKTTDSREFLVGVYRGEFSYSNDSLIQSWISWVNPNTEKPDFHVPASLGYWELVE